MLSILRVPHDELLSLGLMLGRLPEAFTAHEVVLARAKRTLKSWESSPVSVIQSVYFSDFKFQALSDVSDVTNSGIRASCVHVCLGDDPRFPEVDLGPALGLS